MSGRKRRLDEGIMADRLEEDIASPARCFLSTCSAVCQTDDSYLLRARQQHLEIPHTLLSTLLSMARPTPFSVRRLPYAIQAGRSCWHSAIPQATVDVIVNCERTLQSKATGVVYSLSQSGLHDMGALTEVVDKYKSD
jgi:hypothetical protein